MCKRKQYTLEVISEVIPERPPAIKQFDTSTLIFFTKFCALIILSQSPK